MIMMMIIVIIIIVIIISIIIIIRIIIIVLIFIIIIISSTFVARTMRTCSWARYFARSRETEGGWPGSDRAEGRPGRTPTGILD